ncbi:DNA repair protein RecO [Granulibacter bethesdensis]|uniref:DNA repair protein RecO n=1 Tax=Granulibacter bethesdensis TaxID=364410 RepID=UPI00090A055D|nr:DNA repair protein RecO [Granulibacter bethesdensis]APH59328.1 DNA repair protein recO [Granulibacter bethesdensis]
MEWTAPCIVLSAQPYGEADCLAAVFSEDQGLYRGLVRGGTSRQHGGIWQPGNLVMARWTARLADQLGSLTAELIHPAAALAMDDPLNLAVLRSLCTVAEGALPDREAHPAAFIPLPGLLTRLSLGGGQVVEDAIRWEAILLRELGYGLDLQRCAVTGQVSGLHYVSPRSGRAVSSDAAEPWLDRLLPLPAFLLHQAETDSDPVAWRDGLRLTGYFLSRDVFGTRHRPLPPARMSLYDRIAALTETEREHA